MFKEFLNLHRKTITNNDPNNGICYDGAVNPDKYFSPKYRLLFLLKETNGNDNNGTEKAIQTDWDYMDWIALSAQTKSLYRSVFRNIAMWSTQFSLFSSGKAPTESDFFDNGTLIISDNLCESLNNIAIINLKKSWGTAQTQWKDMKNYLEGDSARKAILLHQVKTLKPTLVLCGGTFDFAQMIFGQNSPTHNIKCDDGQMIEYFISSNTVFTSCYHPSKPGWARKASFAHANNIFKAYFDGKYI